MSDTKRISDLDLVLHGTTSPGYEFATVPTSDATDAGLRDATTLLNSLGIVGPNIRHVEQGMYPDGKHSADDTWDGPGWCVCGRAWPCEAKRLGEVVAALATPAPPRIDVGRLARALVALARQQDPDALDADDDLVVAIALNPDDPADMAYAIAKAYEEDVT